MRQLCLGLAVVFAVWLGCAPWVLGYGATALAVVAAAAALVALSGLLVGLFASKVRGVVAASIVGLAGLWFVVSGFWVFGAFHPNEVFVGAVVVLLSLLAGQIPSGRAAVIYTKDGKVLVEMSRMGPSKGRIELKGKTFGSMPATMYLHPVDVWNAVGLVPFSVVARLPVLLVTGWRASRRSSGEPATAGQGRSSVGWR